MSLREVGDLVTLSESEGAALGLSGILYNMRISRRRRPDETSRLTHFMLFAGVSWPNIVLSSKMAV